jgi:RNA polymerase sigma-70 factor, ECF subfamily
VKQSDNQQREFVRLLAKHERQLAAYVHTLVPRWQDAEDVLQNVKIRLWEQFDSYRRDADFGAWAIAIASYMIRTYRKSHQRQRVCFNDELLERIAKYVPAISSPLEDDRASAVMECVRLLNDAHRELLRRFCTTRRKIKDIACELGQTPSATRMALLRIRRSLFECVKKRLREGGGR